MSLPREDSKPWYRQFWPWFLISLPAAVVIASMITIGIALDSDDGLVRDDYYKEGLAIHMDAARFEMAKQLGVQAAVEIDRSSGEIAVELNDAAIGNIPALTLTFFHPTRADNDHRVTLERIANGRYVGPAVELAPANWRVSLDPPEENWRITGRMPVPQQWSARLD